MVKIIPWRLFGGVIHEKLDVSDVPYFITGKIMDDISFFDFQENYSNTEARSDNVAIATIIQEAFYVISYGRLLEESNYDIGTQNIQRLDLVDSIICNYMQYTRLLHLEVGYFQNGIDTTKSDKPLEKQIYSFFNDIKSISIKNSREQLQKILSFEVELSDSRINNLIRKLIRNIQNIIRANQHMPHSIRTIELEISMWLFDEKFESNDRYSLRLNLLKELIQAYRKLPYPYVHGSIERSFRLNHFHSPFRSKFWPPHQLSFVNMIMNVFDDDGFSYTTSNLLSLEISRTNDFLQDFGNIHSLKISDPDIDSILEDIRRELNRLGMKKYTEKEGCFAYLNNLTQNKKLFALSGLGENTSAEARELEAILKSKGLERAILVPNKKRKINKSARYHIHTDINKYITYTDFLYSPSRNNRLFSCCERKLIAYTQKNDEYHIVVRKEPCYMCNDAVTWSERYYAQTIYLHPERESSDSPYSNENDADANSIYINNTTTTTT